MSEQNMQTELSQHKSNRHLGRLLVGSVAGVTMVVASANDVFRERGGPHAVVCTAVVAIVVLIALVRIDRR